MWLKLFGGFRTGMPKLKIRQDLQDLQHLFLKLPSCKSCLSCQKTAKLRHQSSVIIDLPQVIIQMRQQVQKHVIHRYNLTMFLDRIIARQLLRR